MKNDFIFCPICASKNITNINNRKWECPDCGFVLYNNSATAVGVIIVNDSGQVLFEVRAKEPRFGLLDMPGGFVEHDESVEQASGRECREELGVDINIIKYLCTFPNTYRYKNFEYKTCDVFFIAKIADGAEFRLQSSEVSGVKWCSVNNHDDLEKLPLAFDSAYRALDFYLKNK